MDIKTNTQIEAQDALKIRGCATKKDNLLKFRATPSEQQTINSLMTAWQLSNKSGVFHKILASFHGVVIERAERITEVKALLNKFQIQPHELFSKK
jgi:hypothetical protein